VLGWLWRVAVRETHRLQGVERRQQALHEDRSEARDVIGPRQTWLEAVDSLRTLPRRQRRMLGLRAGGHDYQEIASATGDSSRTIDRQLVRARKRLAAAR
jgi:DNA-directed RNA polymerase specialized sigma24 family protein